MSINATTNYMSSSAIEFWMEQKTEDLYGSMRSAMDESNTRADAEQDLNDIKAKILDAKSHGRNADEIRDEVNDTMAKYKDIPEVQDALKPIADSLNKKHSDAENAVSGALGRLSNLIKNPVDSDAYRNALKSAQAAAKPKPITMDENDPDNWTKALGDTVDGLGKKDQMGLINIQEFNSQINQTKQIASALMDAADKAANAIISHIS